jgi:ribosomal-protein-alanine N-acetyltransferase
VILKLRSYAPDDFESLYQIDQVCYEPGIAYSRRELRRYLQFPGAECVVAEAEEPATSASETRLRDAGLARIEGFCITTHEKSRGYIVTIDVLPGTRRRGVGTKLLKEVEQRLAAKGVREVGLETATDNESAVAFWQKHGYRTRGVQKGYYPGGRDAYAMMKTLSVHESGGCHC